MPHIQGFSRVRVFGVNQEGKGEFVVGVSAFFLPFFLRLFHATFAARVQTGLLNFKPPEGRKLSLRECEALREGK